MRQLFILYFLIMFACVSIRAQYPQVRNFSTSDYQGGTQNWCFEEGPNQRVFIGNNQGLLTFDGSSWTLHYVSNYSVVRALLFDQSSLRLYAGASDELGYFEMDLQHMDITYHSLTSLLPSGKKSIGEVWRIMSSGDNIVFQSKEELLVYSPKQQQIKTISNGQRIECAAHIDGRIITAGSEGVCVMTHNALTPLPGTEQLKGKVVRSILKHGAQTLFVTSSDGVLAYDGQQLHALDLPIMPYLHDNQIFCAAIDGDNIAFGTVRGGMVTYNLKNGQTAYANINSWLQNNTVLSMMFDRNHNLWLGLDNGISYVMSEAPYSSLINSFSHIGTGYAAIVSGQWLYLGTNQGLFATPFPITQHQTPITPTLLPDMTGQVWALTDIQGTLLCGSDNGAYVIRGLTAEHISGVKGTWNFAALPHHEQMVLGCDYTGFFVLERQGSTYRLHHRIKGLNLSGGDFYVDNDESIWISHWQKGIYHVQLNDDLTETTRTDYFHEGNGLIMDRGNLLCRIDGRVYVSCVDGLYGYDPKSRQLKLDKQKSSIFNTYGTALRICQTASNDLWACKPGFLALAIRQSDGSYRLDSLSYRNASQRLHIGGNSPFQLDSQHTLINGNEGFFVLNNRYHDKSQPALTYIRRVVSTDEGNQILYLNLNADELEQQIRIPHTQNSIRIEFVQTEFRDDKAVSYQCMLEGYDKDWSQPQRTTAKDYTKLPKGTYVFHVRALNALNGTTEEASISIVVLPAWYETWWAYLLYALLTVALVYWLLRYLKQRSERELVKVKAEKERQLKQQQQQFSLEQAENERELLKLRTKQLEYDMKSNASKLADSTINLMRKNDMLLSLDTQMEQLSESVRQEAPKANINRMIKDIRRGIQQNINDDENWEKFEETFNLVYDNYMRKLTEHFPDLKLNDRKLCAYLRMGLSSKEMASLLNTSTRSIETARYRLRKKLQMDSGENLKEFIQSFEG